ncbi:MAG: HAMP domain-containing histidine kinase [Actinomycetota bacterium]|nr:HAMP domain-containing histidine kinase [Actinomycetota bacterium]
MTPERGDRVRRLVVRVALSATAVVGLGYLLVAVAVVAIVTNDLTAQVDRRLGQSAESIARGVAPPVARPFPAPPADRRFPILLAWVVTGDGSVISGEGTPALPAGYRPVTAPQTVMLEGTEMRLLAKRVGDAYLVVGQSLDPVSQARSTVILAELIIAPILLGIVFFGAVAIGRRVASPIERARRRQLEFTADASHELRTPLSVIEAQASLALTQDRTPAWYRSAFERVDREAKRMRRLVDDLLWLARFDATQAPAHAEPVDLAVLAAQAADRFGVLASTRDLRVTVDAEPEGAIVAAPAEWLDRLLGVLLDNACKYSPPGGAVAVSVVNEGQRVRLAVDDSGPGIPDDERERIFDRFHRATEASGGAGLGLAIADAVVRATGGRWQVGSSPAGGARMSVSWPRASFRDRNVAVPATTRAVRED